MSELIKTNSPNRRMQLLASVSAVTLLYSAAGAVLAAAAESGDHPKVWIELGGQLEQLSNSEEPFEAPFLFTTPSPPILQAINPSAIESKEKSFSFGGEGKISFQPVPDSWTFSAGIRFGRSSGRAQGYQKSEVTHAPTIGLSGRTSYIDRGYNNFVRVSSRRLESHTILDFDVGKDVGFGLLGRSTTSTFNLGVRFAQLSSRASANVRMRPDVHYSNLFFPPKYQPAFVYHTYSISGHSTRSFHGVGPSLSMSAVTTLAKGADDTEFTLDWGINAAVLFGRQKAMVTHQTTGQYVKLKYVPPKNPPSAYSSYYLTHQYKSRYAHTASVHRARSIMVPNLGGFAGLSARYSNARISIGYRADFFFGAMDTGDLTRKSSNVGFYGPFATISIGLGG